MTAIDRTVCDECGADIYQHADTPWLHTDTGLRWCYRDQAHTEVARPFFCEAKSVPSPAIIGYLVQCEVCPQQALLDGYAEGWICPRCTEVAEPTEPDGPIGVIPIEVGSVTFKVPVQEIDGVWYATGRAVRVVDEDDEEYPLGKVQG